MQRRAVGNDAVDQRGTVRFYFVVNCGYGGARRVYVGSINRQRHGGHRNGVCHLVARTCYRNGGFELGASPVDVGEICGIAITDGQRNQTVGVAGYALRLRINRHIGCVQYLDGHADGLVGCQTVVCVAHYSLVTDGIVLCHDSQCH